MGAIEKIPYLKEVGIYFLKYIAIFLILKEIFDYFRVYELMLFIALVLFLSFPMKIHYLPFFLINYLVFVYLALLATSEFILLFIYIFNILINTLIIMIYIKRKVVN